MLGVAGDSPFGSAGDFEGSPSRERQLHGSNLQPQSSLPTDWPPFTTIDFEGYTRDKSDTLQGIKIWIKMPTAAKEDDQIRAGSGCKDEGRGSAGSST
jgi:hypothetical protein